SAPVFVFGPEDPSATFSVHGDGAFVKVTTAFSDRERFTPGAIFLDAQPNLVATGFFGEIGEIGRLLFHSAGAFIAVQTWRKSDPGCVGIAIGTDCECWEIVVVAAV